MTTRASFREVRGTGISLLASRQRRPIVMVLGMHRSGTSLCSHVLSALGLDMTDNMGAPGHDGPRHDNPLGHWERWEIVEFHDRILRFFNREFFNHSHDFALPVAWWADPRVAEVRREITAFLEGRMGNGYFGFKDPRTVRLMPMWHQIINELKLAPKIVFCLRNPAQVARSLHVRDGISLDIGEYRWFSYTVDFFRYTKSAEICTIEYESWFEDPALNLRKLRNFLDIPEDRTGFEIDSEIGDIVRHDVRHDDPRLREASQPTIRSVYKLARQADHDAAAREQVQTIATQFVAFQQLQNAFQQEFEHYAAIVAKLPTLEQEVVALRAAVGKRDAQIEAVRAEANASAARAGEAVAEIEQQHAQLVVLVCERDATARTLEAARSEPRASVAAADALATAMTELREARAGAEGWEADAVPDLRAVLARLSDTLVRAGEVVSERAGLIAALRAERLSLDEGLAEARREAHERAAEIARLESEVAAWRAANERAEQEGEARTAEVNQLERETRELSETVTCALRDREQSAAAAKSVEVQLAMAQSALAAARQFGRAAINALAIDEPIPVAYPRRLGRWQAIRGWFGVAGSV